MTEEQQLLVGLWLQYSRWIDDHGTVSYDSGGKKILQELEVYLQKNKLIKDNGEMV